MNKLEKDIEHRLVVIAKKHGAMCLKWVSPGNSGVPDRLILAPGGRIIFVETKRPTGKLRVLQEWWGQQLRGLGMTHMTVRNETDLEAVDWLLSYEEHNRGGLVD